MTEKQKKLRIMAVSDLHGDSALVKKLAEKSEKENIDIIVLCGDVTGWTETKNFIKPFKDRHKEVIIIPGNHDTLATTEFLATFYGLKNIHGYSIRFGNVGFFGAGGADIGPGFAVSEKELLNTLEKAHAGLSGVEKKIMVTHMHPESSKSEFSGFRGSAAILHAIKKFRPSYLLHGHIHEGSGLEEKIGDTKVINVGREGRIIEL